VAHLAEAAVAAGTRMSGTSKQQALLQEEVQKDSRPLAAALEQALALEW